MNCSRALEGMKDIKKTIKKMGKAFYTSKMEVCMMVNGRMTKCMALDTCTTKLDKWLMKVIGKMISSTGEVEYTMIGHKNFNIHLTLMILLL